MFYLAVVPEKGDIVDRGLDAEDQSELVVELQGHRSHGVFDPRSLDADVEPDNIATFLGKKLVPQFQGEMGNRFNIRIEGTRIKHTMGPVSLKLYDKFGLILRIETTVNDVSFFRHYRKVEHRDGTSETKWAPMLKTVYSLPALRELLVAANRRYLEFLSTI